LNKLSLGAISNIPDVACLSVSPPCPHQLEVKKSRGELVPLTAVNRSKAARVAPASEKGRGERERKRQSGRGSERVREREREGEGERGR
jgi:hypothetical protein